MYLTTTHHRTGPPLGRSGFRFTRKHAWSNPPAISVHGDCTTPVVLGARGARGVTRVGSGRCCQGSANVGVCEPSMPDLARRVECPCHNILSLRTSSCCVPCFGVCTTMAADLFSSGLVQVVVAAVRTSRSTRVARRSTCTPRVSCVPEQISSSHRS